LVRRVRQSDLVPLALLCLASVLLGSAAYGLPDAVPLTALVIPMVIANLVLAPRRLPWALVFTLIVVLVVVVLSGHSQLTSRRIGGVVVIVLIGLVILATSLRRARLGVAGLRGESMLVDLRDRIAYQAQMPPLPDPWYVDAVLRSAGGSSFAGDFMVAARTGAGDRLEVAVVDVSGKGEQAGSRSLLLSGAFGGLLSALPSDQFLPAANGYLLRQDWPEGFATAVHLSLDLVTGDFEIRSAGHPPGAQLLAGSGRWRVLEAEGPVLGLMSDASFTVVSGTVSRGDTLLLFTDGLVETSQRDISSGIDRLIGMGEQLLRTGVDDGAHRILDRLQSGDDDQALLLLHRP
jgi:hypothetical protein